MITKLKNIFESEKHQTWLTYAWLLFLCLLSYGILIPTLGFYWDDLPILFLYKTFGAGGFPEFLASDRPYSAWNFMLTTSLFQFNPLGYHLLALGLRFLTVILFHQILKTIWPEKSKTAAIAASIFAIYPGFHQQPIALIYSHHLSVFSACLLSILLMLKNAKNERFNWFMGITSWILTLHMFSIENFATLEAIRPFLLWLVLNRQSSGPVRIKLTLKAVIRIWLPHLIILVSFLVWRVFIFKFPTYEPDLLEGYQSNPGNTLTSLLERIPKDFYTVTVGAWLKSFQIPVISDFGTSATYLFWALVVAALLASAVVLALLPSDKAQNGNENMTLPDGILRNRQAQGSLFHNKRKIFLEILIVGVLLYFMAASIVWVLDLPLEIEFAWDRMTLAYIPAVALLIGLIYAISGKLKFLRNLAVCLLIASAVGAHFENGMSYKRDWEDMKDLFWQMSWRMPDLEPGTAVIGSGIGLDYYSDNSLTSPLNLQYAPDNKSYDLGYVFYYTDVRVGGWLPALKRGLPIHQPFRSFDFNGSTNNVVAIRYDPPGCLQVMDGTFANSISLPNLTEMQVNEIRLSDLSLIKNEPQNQPLADIFGEEPPVNWCYYFEKADLARQYGSYVEAAALGEEAIQQGFAPRAASEWLPFLESNIKLANWDRVDYIIEQVHSTPGNYMNGVCNTLQSLSKDEEIPDHNRLSDYMRDYNCP